MKRWWKITGDSGRRRGKRKASNGDGGGRDNEGQGAEEV